MTAQNPKRAALWMLGSIAAFTAMAIAVRAVQHLHDPFEIMTARSAIGFVLVCSTAAALGRLSEVSRARLAGHFLRNIVHFAGQNLWLLSLSLIPLAQVFALEFTSPIWVILLSPFVLKERLTAAKLLSVTLGFIGILLVAKPDLTHVNVGVVAALAAAVSFAMTALLTKALTRKETLISILFWLTGMQFCFGLIMTLADGVVHWPTAETAPWLGLVGVCGVCAHLSLTQALRLAPASFVVPIDFLRLPLIAAIGAAFYNESVDALWVAGSVLIFVGIFVNLRVQFAQNRAEIPTKNP